MNKYDFALSFAGENREIAESLALKLIEKGIRVFYDNFETHELWGEDLAERLFRIYSKESKYCIILISQSYLNKMWTTHERKSALQKQLKQKGGYILPIKIEDVQLPGLNETIGYISLDEYSIDDIADMALSKLGIPDPEDIITEPIPIIDDIFILSELSDERIDRHDLLSNIMFEKRSNQFFYQMHSLSYDKIQIKDDTYQNTLLSHDNRYSEALHYSEPEVVHLNGYTKKLIYRDPDRLISAVTGYYDGHIITEEIMESDKFNPSFFLYAVQRHLQLSREIFEEYIQEFNFIIKLVNLKDVSWEIFPYGYERGGLKPYSGYHEDIIVKIELNKIYGREKWNNQMPLAINILKKMARIFGMSELPQNYWDKNGLLSYSKVGFR